MNLKIQLIEKENSNFLTKISTLENDVKVAVKENEILLNKAEIQNVLNESLQKNIDDFCKAKNDNLANENIRVQDRKEEYDAMITQLKDLELKNLTQNQIIIKLQDDMEEKNKYCQIIDLEKKEQQEKNSIDLKNLLNENKKLLDEHEKEKIDNKTKISEMEILKFKLESTENNYENKILELKSLNELFERKCIIIESLEKKHSEELKSSNQQIESSDINSENFNLKIVEMNSEIESNKTENKILRDEIKVFEKREECRHIKQNKIEDHDGGEMEDIALEAKIGISVQSYEGDSDVSNNNENNNENNNNNNKNNNDSDNVLSPISTGEIIYKEDMEVNAAKIKLLKNEIENYQLIISKLSSELTISKENFSFLKEITDKESNEEKNILSDKKECSMKKVNSIKENQAEKLLTHSLEIRNLKSDYSKFKKSLSDDVDRFQEEVFDFKKSIDDQLMKNHEIINLDEKKKKIQEKKSLLLSEEHSSSKSSSPDFLANHELKNSIPKETVQDVSMISNQESEGTKSLLEISKCKNLVFEGKNSESNKIENVTFIPQIEIEDKLIENQKEEIEMNKLLDIIEKNENVLREKIEKIEEEKLRTAELEESIRILKINVHESSTECELLRVSLFLS